jgi:cell division septal protein FtsQ
VLIDEYGPQYAEFDLPIVDGLTVGAENGAKVERFRSALASRLLASLASHPDLGTRVSQIDVADAHDAVVLLEGDAALIHLGEEKFADRLRSYVELAPALHERVPDIDYVDLRFDDRVYVRPGGKDAGTAPVARRY